MDSDVRYVMSVCSLCVQTKNEAESRAQGCSQELFHKRGHFTLYIHVHCAPNQDLLQMTSNTNSSIDASKTKHP